MFMEFISFAEINALRVLTNIRSRTAYFSSYSHVSFSCWICYVNLILAITLMASNYLPGKLFSSIKARNRLKFLIVHTFIVVKIRQNCAGSFLLIGGAWPMFYTITSRYNSYLLTYPMP